MKLKHKEKGYIITVASRHGKPLLNRKGFVTASGNGYKGMRMFPMSVLEDKFMELSCN